MTHTIYSHRHENGASWCIEQQPSNVTDPMVVSFRRWNSVRSLLNRNARWTPDGWDPTYWVPKPPTVPAAILHKVETFMRLLG